jgi:hypothetical protein
MVLNQMKPVNIIYGLFNYPLGDHLIFI